MLNNGLNPSICNYEGIRLLHLCWQLDNNVKVSIIFDYGSDPKQLNIYGQTPLITELKVQNDQ